jgi:hypothetical protein
MGTLIVKAIVLLTLPLVVFVGGGYLMQRLSDPSKVREKINEKNDYTGLGLRCTGYNLGEVKTYWEALSDNPEALAADRRMLEIDLLFPFFYGAAFAVTLLFAWAELVRPFHPVWILAPLFIEVVADWIENLIQLKQLKLFTSNQALQAGWIQIASLATIVKYWLFIGSYILVIGLVVWMVYKNWPRSSAR